MTPGISVQRWARMTARIDTNEDDMASTAGTRRKTKLVQHRTSALHALRASGLVGLFAGPPDLASSRKRLLKEKLRGKTGAAR